MTSELYDWLKFIFYRDNHKKYHKYFNEWVKNLTPHQEFYFMKQKISIDNNLMIEKK